MALLQAVGPFLLRGTERTVPVNPDFAHVPDLDPSRSAFASTLTPAAPENSISHLFAEGSALLSQGRTAFSESLSPDAPVVDLPGVGACVTDERGIPFLLGTPEPLLGMLRKEETREALLIKLLFAARDLAEWTVELIHLPYLGPDSVSRIFRCRECRRANFAADTIKHKRNCHVDRVLTLLDELSAAKSAPQPGRHCAACNATDNAWVTEEKLATTVDLGKLEMNQAVSVEVHEGMRTVHTHLCASELAVQA